MQIEIENIAQRNKYLSLIKERAEDSSFAEIKYLDFGVKVIRVMYYTPEIILFLRQHFSFVLRDNITHFDETIVFWKETNVAKLASKLDYRFNTSLNFRFRIQLLQTKMPYPDIFLMDKDFSPIIPLISLKNSLGVAEAYDVENHVCYLGITDLAPEELIKWGHLFVQQLNILLKSEGVNLVHGAILGYNGQGVLLCARGQRGKSTLTVHSLLNGCEYVSDDYQLLEQDGNSIYSYPMYSIITLSPQMYSAMYDDFEGKFCSNNGRKDKYVFDISKYHNQFKTHYPIKVCLFPEIVNDALPSIKCCLPEDKGRAIVQMIHSTVLQMRDLNDHATIEKLFNMVCHLPFYKFNLCPHIAENTKYLYQFLTQPLPPVSEQEHLPRFLIDITFDLANILDTKTFTFYSLNKFATNLYEMMLSGITHEQIKERLNVLTAYNAQLIDEFDLLVKMFNEEDLLSAARTTSPLKNDLVVDFAKECGYKLSLSRFDKDKTNELINIEQGS